MKKYKQGITGFIIGAMLFSMISVAADMKPIEAFFNDIKITYNGVAIEMDTEPFIYNSRTYVPVSFIAKTFGKEVKWNETSNEVEITDPAVTKPKDDYAIDLNILEKTNQDGFVGVTYNGSFYVRLGDLVYKYAVHTFSNTDSDTNTSAIYTLELNKETGIYTLKNTRNNKSVVFDYKDPSTCIQTRPIQYFFNYSLLKDILTEKPLLGDNMKRSLKGNLYYYTYDNNENEKYVSTRDIIREIAREFDKPNLLVIKDVMNKENGTISYVKMKPIELNKRDKMTLEEVKNYEDDINNYDIYLEGIKAIQVIGENFYVIPYDDYINDIKPKLLKALGIE